MSAHLPPDASAALYGRYLAVRRRLDDAAAASGRSLAEVRLIAVSKTHPPEPVAELARLWGEGVPAFGENYIQEALTKQDAVAALLRGAENAAPQPEWHCIGHVQSRKAKDVAGRFALIHTLDSEKLARNLQKALRADGHSLQRVLIQVNIGREAQKSGVMPEEAEHLITAVRGMTELSIEGLMCIPPLDGGAEDSRPHFAALRTLRDRLRTACGLELPHLSMGMSHDCEVAVAEGATLVRVGTDIFGARPSRA